jgi:hypothetical protein
VDVLAVFEFDGGALLREDRKLAHQADSYRASLFPHRRTPYVRSGQPSQDSARCPVDPVGYSHLMGLKSLLVRRLAKGWGAGGTRGQTGRAPFSCDQESANRAPLCSGEDRNGGHSVVLFFPTQLLGRSSPASLALRAQIASLRRRATPFDATL